MNICRVSVRRVMLLFSFSLFLPGVTMASGPSLHEVPEALQRDELRVCADPNNLPYSNRRGEGFENKLAEMVARDLGKTVSYFWHAQRRGFLRSTLGADKCDVILGMTPNGRVATTRSYYRSSYVFVSRADRDLEFSSMQAPELHDLRIGVHLIGDDGTNPPPAHALGQQGIVENVEGYLIYGDYREESPPSALIKAVASGEIDLAAAWGPLAGYYASQSDVPLRIVPITDTLEYMPMLFQYAIVMGVQKTNPELKRQLNEVIYQRKEEIQALLERYGVPLAGQGAMILGGR